MAIRSETKIEGRMQRNSLRKSQAERRQMAERRILDAAMRLISERGVERTTFEEIAALAGCSRGLPFHYFGTKENLLGRIATDLGSRLMTTMEEAEHKSATAIDRIAAFVELYFSGTQSSNIWMGRALYILRAESLIGAETLKRAVAEAVEAPLQRLVDIITAGQALGEIRSDADPRAYALFIAGALRGIAGFYLSDPNAVAIDATTRELVRAIRSDLTARLCGGAPPLRRKTTGDAR
jgi:AcrR family transcriptional regulator